MNLKNIDHRLATILLIVFVGMVGAAMILPILPLYAQREFGMSAQVITLLNASFYAAQFIAGPYLGRLSDRIGRLPVLIVSQIGTALSFVLLAWAPGAGMLFAARILDGITGGNIIVAQAYITDITPKEKRTEALGYILAVFGLGFIVGPALGGLLAAAFGPRIPYLIAAGVALVVVLLTWLLLDETVDTSKGAASQRAQQPKLALSQVVRNRSLFFVLLIAIVAQFGFGLLQSTFALYGAAVLFQGASDQATNLGVGLLLAFVGAGQFFTQTWLLRRLLKRFNEAKLVIIGLVLRTVGMLLFAIITTPWLGPIASVLFAIGMGVVMPSLQSMATVTVDDHMRGGVLGFFQSANSLAIILSTGVAGVIFAVSPTMPFWLGSALTALAIAPALVLLGQVRRGELKTASQAARG